MLYKADRLYHLPTSICSVDTLQTNIFPNNIEQPPKLEPLSLALRLTSEPSSAAVRSVLHGTFKSASPSAMLTSTVTQLPARKAQVPVTKDPSYNQQRYEAAPCRAGPWGPDSHNLGRECIYDQIKHAGHIFQRPAKASL